MVGLARFLQHTALTLSLMFLLCACGPNRKIALPSYIPEAGKIPAKVALILDKEARKQKFEYQYLGKCLTQNLKLVNDSMFGTIPVGTYNEQLSEVISNIISNVETFDSMREFDKKSYDYIIIPKFSIDLDYNDVQMKNRIWKNKSYTNYECNSSGKCYNVKHEYLDTDGTFDITSKLKIVLTFIDTSNMNEKYIEFESIDTFKETEKSCGRQKTTKDFYFDKAITVSSMNRIIQSAFADLSRKIDNNLFPVVQAKLQEKALPSDISLSSNISSIDGNSIISQLNAAESAQLYITLKNSGKGTSYATILEATADNSKITIDKSITIGDIPPGETREIKVPLKTGVDLETGQATFQIQAKEKRGYDSKRVVMKIPTAALEKPGLAIADYRINDGNTGFASGNGNGIPENGETIEIVPLVKNNGVGKAVRVKVAISSLSSGIEIKEESAVIPEIAPGETGSVKLALHIPTTYSGGAISVKFNAVDVRGNAVSSAERQFALNTEVNRPILAYSWRLLDKNGKEKEYLNNGEEGEIEIRTRNTGKLEARNVNIAVNSGVASFGKSSDSISRIAAEADYAPIRFPFTVPRAFEGSTMDVTVRLEQKDFPGLSDPRSIPIRLVKPELRVSHQVISPSGNNALKQGESAEVLIRVDNTGQLDAEQVVLSLDITRKGILMKSAKEASLGRIESGKSATARYNVDVQRSTESGSLPIQVSITQKSFSGNNEQITLAVLKEQDEIITVQGEGRSKPVVAAPSGGSNIPPMIVLAQPRDNARVASESIHLSGIASAVNGVSSMEIRLNGKILDNVNRGLKVVGKGANELSEKDINEQIPLQPGKNEITVTVYDNKYLSKTKSVTVFRETKKGNVYAAVIGLNKYQAPGMNLKYARNDAEAFASYMKNNMGLVPNQTLFELYDEKATSRGIKSLLGTKLRQLARNSEDTVYIYFAGHGAPEQDSSAQDEDRIRKYLLAHDTETNDLYGTTIPMDEVAKIISSLNADRVIFIMDACYSGEAGGRTMLAKGTRAVLSEDFLNRMAAGKGRIILTSSKPNETSQEDDNLKHGYFTYNLLEGLKGKADYNGDGIIDIDEIAMYLNKTVPEQTSGKQHPVKKGEAEGQVIIGKVR